MSLLFRRGVLLAALWSASAAFADPPQTPPVAETITVTATRSEKRLGETPASVVVVSRRELVTSPAPTIDDALRQVPGFALFRRTGSRTANPTSQGVSLRGIGASGASRALVLDDGIPLNDAFGGWVYWSRLPREAFERIEVLRGGASDLYGSAAMGGVVQLIRRRDAGLVTGEASRGSEATSSGSLYASTGTGLWRGSLAIDLLDTGGYVAVAPESRGLVDRASTSRHASVDATLSRGAAFVRVARYRESRGNGTPLQVNDTTFRQVAAGADAPLAGGSATVRAWAGDQDYAQTFSSISSDRNSERLTVDQRVPSRSAGMTVQLSRVVADRHALVAGFDAAQVGGTTAEVLYGAATSLTRASGHQRNGALFVEDVFEVSRRFSLTAGLRFDSWSNFDAARDGAPLPSRLDSSWSPRLSALVTVGPQVAITAAVYRAFRAPTLNELYRGFRVGNVVTSANEALGPERLQAAELGVRFGSVRANAFAMKVADAIANVTTNVTPALISRQRRNAGSSLTRGIEIDFERRLAPAAAVSAGYLFSDAVVTSGVLDHKRLPQVPRHEGTLQLALTPGRLTVRLQGRWSAMQYDDDQNRFPLRSYGAADAFASWLLAPRVTVVTALENLFDRRIQSAATPVIALGQPRTVRFGVRFSTRL